MAVTTRPKEARQETALLALVQHPSIRDAAKACGLGETTLYKYLEDDGFKRRLADLRRQAFGDTLEAIKGAGPLAAEAIIRNLTCGSPGVELRAAAIYFDIALKVYEFGDLADQIAAAREMLEKISPVEREQARAAGAA